jgi:hypothetical protein
VDRCARAVWMDGGHAYLPSVCGTSVFPVRKELVELLVVGSGPGLPSTAASSRSPHHPASFCRPAPLRTSLLIFAQIGEYRRRGAGRLFFQRCPYGARYRCLLLVNCERRLPLKAVRAGDDAAHAAGGVSIARSVVGPLRRQLPLKFSWSCGTVTAVEQVPMFPALS